MTEPKSELAIEFDNWLISNEELLLETANIERLKLAFLAGAIANEKVKKEICEKIINEHNHVSGIN